MIGELGSNCRDLAIWQQRHNPSSLEIADNRSVAAIASKSPIVNADNAQRVSSKRCPPPSGATGTGEHRRRTVRRKSAADNQVPRKRTSA
jgi:hypothetical protein